MFVSKRSLRGIKDGEERGKRGKYFMSFAFEFQVIFCFFP